MPPLATRSRHQKAVLWSSTGVADAYGKYQHDDPVEITVRWEWKNFEARDAQGNLIGLAATAVVDRDIPIGSLLWLGELSNWYGTGSSDDDSERMQVATYAEVKDIKGRNTRREVGMMRYRD